MSMSISGLSLKASFIYLFILKSAYINETGKKKKKIRQQAKGGKTIVVLSSVITAGPPGSVANVRVMG